MRSTYDVPVLVPASSAWLLLRSAKIDRPSSTPLDSAYNPEAAVGVVMLEVFCKAQ